MADLPAEADAVVVGAGPAGLSAAAELRRLGVRAVHVLDREAALGGVPRHCGHSPFGLHEFRRPMFGPAYARALAGAARAAGAVAHAGATVVAIEPGPVLTVASDAGVSRIAARAVLLATGARETPRAPRFIGGEKPGGVMVTGALQSLVYGPGLAPFRAPVVLGTELVSFSALLTCRHAGIRPVAMLEPGERITARHPSQLLPRALGVPLSLSTDIAEIEGRAQVEAVVLSTPDGPRRLSADGVIVTGRFRPDASLARAAGLTLDPRTGGPEIDSGGRCAAPGLYAAGNLLRPVETARWCWAEGRAVARTIAADLAGRATTAGAPIKLSGPLKYAVPQRIAPNGALESLQLRVPRAVRGRLSVRLDGREIAARKVDTLPERRLLLPLPAAPGRVDAVLEEA